MMIRIPYLESRKFLKNSNHAKKAKRHTRLFLMYFTEETLTSCSELSLASLKDIELCFHKKVIFQVLYPLLICLIILIQLLRIHISVLTI